MKIFKNYKCYGLVILGLLSTNQFTYVMDRTFGDYIQERVRKQLTRQGSQESKLRDAIFSGDVDQVKNYLESGANVNLKVFIDDATIFGSEYFLLSLAINEANKSFYSQAQNRLTILELLLQKGPVLNDAIHGKRNALEYALLARNVKLNVIRLLLGYGAAITEKGLKLAKDQPNSKELLRIFDIHQRLLKQVQSNPTEELLNVSIKYNKPYIVQLIVNRKPELVTLSDIELARETSPASVQILTKAMEIATEIATLWEVASIKGIPAEITDYIESLLTGSVNKNDESIALGMSPASVSNPEKFQEATEEEIVPF